jgi:TRAP-type C4-dicarboxylate transport system substrate-binding protein
MRLALIGLAAAAAMLAAPVGVPTADAKTYELRWSDIGPPRGPRADALMWWAEQLEKRSDGQIKIKFFWGQSLIKAKDNLRALGSGLVETAQLIATYTPAELPVWNYAGLPFGINDEWVGMRTWAELHRTDKDLLAEAKRNKFVFLFNNTTGPVHLLTTNQAITSVEQLKGKKIRTTGGWTNLMKELGAVPVTIGFGELYAALERGTVDGTINYTPFVKSYKHFEVAGHLTETFMGQVLSYGGGISARVFEGMPKNLQDLLLKVSDEYMEVYAKNQLEDTAQAKKDLIAGIDGKKVQFHALTEEERKRWSDASKVFFDEWIARMEKTGMDAKGFVAKVDKVAAKYDAERKAKGYPWTR